MVRVFLGLILGIGVLAASFGAANAAPAALSARLSQEGGEVSLTVVLSEPLGFRAFTLAEPNRVIIDFPALDWRFAPPRAGESLKLVDGVRTGLARNDVARLVIDLKGPAEIKSAVVEEAEGGARFVLTLRPTDQESFAAKAGWPDTDTAVAAAPDLPAPVLRPKRGVIVAIDAGHGGRDSGATHEGLYEKDLVLQYASELAAILTLEPGVTPYLIRRGDEYIRLRDRVRRARRADADVIISLHADALESGSASGASVFVLSEEASNAEAAELVTSHNRADVISGVALDAEEGDVVSVLVDLARRNTGTASDALAREVVYALTKRDIELEGRALQSAAFRVLKAPDVPSILVEIGFLSAAKDRARLTTAQGRRDVVEALAEGIFSWLDATGRSQTGGNDN